MLGGEANQWGQPISTLAAMDFPCLFSQPVLVSPDVQVIIQNCGNVDVKLPHCTLVGLIENLQNTEFFLMLALLRRASF
jgi:hypothetical protein